MTVDFDAWAARGDAIRIFLIETYAVRLSDSVTIPLFLSNHPAYFPDCQFLPVLSGAPTLSRTANDIVTPNHCPSWGELEFLIAPGYMPDSERSVTWSELLSDDYNLIGQKLYIRLGGVGFAYTDFVKIFDGAIGGLGEWTDSSLKLTIYDKSHDLEAKLPDWGINSIFVPADSRGKTLPIQLGHCLNIKPVLINNADTFLCGYFPPLITPAHQYRWALAGHTISAIEDVFDNGVSILGTVMFYQKDVSIPSKNANGAALCWNSGPYTGPEVERNWLIEIDSVAAGTSIWYATFRWSVDGGITWMASGVQTAPLIYLDAGVNLQFVSTGYVDFSVGDQWTFRTISTIVADTLSSDANITVNLYGMVSQVYGGYIDRISHFFHELPVRYKGWDPVTDFDTDALATFYAMFNFAIQYSSDEPSTILDIFDTLLVGIPGYYSTRQDGKLLLAPIEAPSGTPGAIFSEVEIMDPPTFKFDTDNLYYRVFLNYDHNPNINDKPDVGAGIYFSNWLKFEWRSLQASMPTILENYPWALDLGPLDTCIYSMEWSNWVAWQLLALYGVRRQIVTIVTEIKPFAYDLGMVVELIWPAFGLESGKLFRLIGMDLDFSNNQSTLTLWR